MTQHNFMRNVRMVLPQYITNVTSFKDSIKILKNKGILNECECDINNINLNEKNLDVDPKELQKGIEVEMEHTDDPVKAEQIALDHLAEDPQYYTKLATIEPEHSGDPTLTGHMAKLARDLQKGLRENENNITNFKVKHGSEGPSHDPYGYTEYSFTKDGNSYIVHIGLVQYIKINGKSIQAANVGLYDNEEQFIKKYTGVDYQTLYDLEEKNYINYDEDPMGHPSIYMENIQKERKKYKALKEGAGIFTDLNQAKKEAKDEKSKGINVNGKSIYSQFKEIDNLNAQEVLIGIDYEMEKNHELTKLAAAKIVLKNLKKNPIYYTMEYLAGKEGAEPEYMGGKSAQPEAHKMQPYAADKVVDKKMGMQPVKGIEKPKKDADARKETNKVVKGVELMDFLAQTVRNIQKMAATGEKMKKISVKEGFEPGDKVLYNNEEFKVTRTSDDGRVYIKSIKASGRPETWVKPEDLEKEALDSNTAQSVLDALEKGYEVEEITRPEEIDALYTLRSKGYAKKEFGGIDPASGEEITYWDFTPKGEIEIQSVDDIIRILGTTSIQESVDKALAKERLKEMIRQELKEITGAYGGDDVDGEDGSSYLEEEAKINTTDIFDIHPLTGAPIKGVKFTDATHYYLVNDPKKTEKVKPENARVKISK